MFNVLLKYRSHPGALSVCRTISFLLLMTLAAIPSAKAQRASGLIAFNRLGLSYQRDFGIDIGLLSYNILFGYQNARFFDVSMGTEAVFAERFTLVPKLNIDAGIPFSGDLTIGGGLDTGWQTDFSGGGIRFTPKGGFTLGSVFRLYYGYHLYPAGPVTGNTGRHRVSFELNIAAFHNFRIGI